VGGARVRDVGCWAPFSFVDAVEQRPCTFAATKCEHQILKTFPRPGCTVFTTVSVDPSDVAKIESFSGRYCGGKSRLIGFLATKTPLNGHEPVAVYQNKPDLQLIAMLSLILAAGPENIGDAGSLAT